MNEKKNMNSKGFSFIEVLVVSTIIAVLTAVGVSNFRVANQKSRDGKRQGDLEQIRAALELYRTDQNIYPLFLPAAGGTLSEGGTTYMNNIPDDPLEGQDYYYNTADIGLTYTLCAALELDTTGSCAGGDCGDGDCNYQIDNPL